MRLFFDVNIMTYIAFFEGYMVEGTTAEFEADCQWWAFLQLGQPDEQLVVEVHALRQLYLLDNRAHFDWLCSDIAIEEVLRIRQRLKRDTHRDLLQRLIEHRQDIYVEEGTSVLPDYREDLRHQYFPSLPRKMHDDARQCCEAMIVDADFFVTNDARFIKRAGTSGIPISVCRISELPFLWRPPNSTPCFGSLLAKCYLT